MSDLARIMHRFLSRSDESAGLTRRATEAPANVLYGTLRRPTECNTGRADDFVAAVENLCIIRARDEMLAFGPDVSCPEAAVMATATVRMMAHDTRTERFCRTALS